MTLQGVRILYYGGFLLVRKQKSISWILIDLKSSELISTENVHNVKKYSESVDSKSSFWTSWHEILNLIVKIVNKSQQNKDVSCKLCQMTWLN